MSKSNVVSLPTHNKTDSKTFDLSKIQNFLESTANQLGEVSTQSAYIIELMTEIKEKNEPQLTSESKYNLTTWKGSDQIFNFEYGYTLPIMTKQKVDEVASIALPALLKTSSTLVLFICIIGLVTWIMGDIAFINPFAALLGIIACPFFYVMGKLIDKP